MTNFFDVKTHIEKKNLFKKCVEKFHLEKYEKQIAGLKDFLVILVYALLLATFFKTFFYENFKIPSGSMNPLLLNGDRILVNKFRYGYTKFSFPFNFAPIQSRILANRTPKRGEIVVFKLPTKEDYTTFYVKRVIGIPGDKIKIDKGRVFVNRNVMKYEPISYLEAYSENNHNHFPSMKYEENNGDVKYDILISDIHSSAENTKEYIVPEGHYFMIGDNRDNSHDSRFDDFNVIPFKNIVGRVEMIFFSTANGKFNFNRIFKNIKAKSVE